MNANLNVTYGTKVTTGFPISEIQGINTTTKKIILLLPSQFSYPTCSREAPASCVAYSSLWLQPVPTPQNQKNQSLARPHCVRPMLYEDIGLVTLGGARSFW